MASFACFDDSDDEVVPKGESALNISREADATTTASSPGETNAAPRHAGFMTKSASGRDIMSRGRTKSSSGEVVRKVKNSEGVQRAVSEVRKIWHQLGFGNIYKVMETKIPGGMLILKEFATDFFTVCASVASGEFECACDDAWSALVLRTIHNGEAMSRDHLKLTNASRYQVEFTLLQLALACLYRVEESTFMTLPDSPSFAAQLDKDYENACRCIDELMISGVAVNVILDQAKKHETWLHDEILFALKPTNFDERKLEQLDRGEVPGPTTSLEDLDVMGRTAVGGRARAGSSMLPDAGDSITPMGGSAAGAFGKNGKRTPEMMGRDLPFKPLTPAEVENIYNHLDNVQIRGLEVDGEHGLFAAVPAGSSKDALEDQKDLQSYVVPFILPHVGDERRGWGWDCFVNFPSLDFWATLHGHRTVPVEVGSSKPKAVGSAAAATNTEKEATMLIRDFVHNMRLLPADRDYKTYYIAQCPLLNMIPELRADIDFEPLAEEVIGRPVAKMNIWMGTCGTITELHFDSLDNLYVQVAGVKRVKLVKPRFYSVDASCEFRHLHSKNMVDLLPGITPPGTPIPNLTIDGESIEIGFADAAIEQRAKDRRQIAQGMSGAGASDGGSAPKGHGNFAGLKVFTPFDSEGGDDDLEVTFDFLLQPGMALHIPKYWWHSFRSETPSVSLNFWFGDEITSMASSPRTPRPRRRD